MVLNRALFGGCFLAVPFVSAALHGVEITSVGFAVENGDVNGDEGRDLSDGIYLLNHLFLGGPEPVPIVDCGLELAIVANGDTNGDAGIDLSDSIRLLSWLFHVAEPPVDACGAEDGDGTGARDGCRPYVAPPHSRAYGKSLAEWLETYWRWYLGTNADPAQSTVGRVQLLPIPSPTQTGGTGTPDDPAVLVGEIELTLPPGTPFVLPQFAWTAETYDPATGIPDDPSLPDDALLAGVSPNLSINGCPAVSDENERRFYVPATAFDPPVIYPQPTSYGSIGALRFQGCGVVGLPLPVGTHVIRLYEPYIIDNVAGFSFGVIYDNTWVIHVSAD